MGIIDMLNEYPFLDEEIQKIRKEIAELEEKRKNVEDTLKAVQINDMPKNPNVIDLVSETVIILAKYTNEIAKLLDKELDLTIQKAQTENLLRQLDPDECTIVKMRHFERKDFRQIGKAVFLSKTRVWEKYQEAIQKLEKKKADKTGQEIGKNGQILGKHVV